VVRIAGVDSVPMVAFERADTGRKPVLTALQNRTRKARRALSARGLVEAITWSFVSKQQAQLFGGGDPTLALANPIAADLSEMRPSLVPGLVVAAKDLSDFKQRHVSVAAIVVSLRGDGPQDQFIAASGVRRGLAKASGWERHWATGSKPVDAFDAKADALAVLAAAGAPMQALQVVSGGPAWLHPGRSGTIQIGPQNVLGYFGELHPRTLEALGAEGPLVALEIILDRVPEPKARPTRAKPPLELSLFQPVERDFAFIVDRIVKAGDLLRAAQGADRKLIAGIGVFDVYEGAGIDPGKKSIAITVTLQPREKTLTDQEIEAVSAKIVAEVEKRVGGVLRG
jgi:phenylalanyl-tRNA synthetase beta chain